MQSVKTLTVTELIPSSLEGNMPGQRLQGQVIQNAACFIPLAWTHSTTGKKPTCIPLTGYC